MLALIPLSLVLGDEKAGCDVRERKGRVSHLLFINDLKLCSKRESARNNREYSAGNFLIVKALGCNSEFVSVAF